MDDQQDSRQRRKGVVDTANNVLGAVSKIRQGAQVAGLVAANIWIVVGIVVGITLLTFILTLSGGSAAGIPTDQQSTTPDGTSFPTGFLSEAGIKTRQAIIDKFGVTMDGFDERHLNAAWEKISETSNTNFPSLIKGAKIQAISQNTSSWTGCEGVTSISLGQYEPLPFFKYIFTHELGHYIQNCKTRSISKSQEHEAAYSQEGPISYYAANAPLCTGSSNLPEDYADMISYYLNPAAGFSTTSCGGRSPTSPPNPLYVAPIKILHYNVARDILTPKTQP